MRMIDRCGDLGFKKEAVFGLGIDQEFRPQELQGDAALEDDVLGFIDDAHAAAADDGLHFVFIGNDLAFLKIESQNTESLGVEGRNRAVFMCPAAAPAAKGAVVGGFRMTIGTFHDSPPTLKVLL